MGRRYASIDEAWRAFHAFVRLEPELTTLWKLCRGAAPPARRAVALDDAYDVDPFEVDVLAGEDAEERWCAEDYFLDHVKSRLLVLVGVYRVRGPRELQSNAAYEMVYDLLINWALRRPCVCCADRDHEPVDDRPPAQW